MKNPRRKPACNPVCSIHAVTPWADSPTCPAYKYPKHAKPHYRLPPMGSEETQAAQHDQPPARGE